MWFDGSSGWNSDQTWLRVATDGRIWVSSQVLLSQYDGRSWKLEVGQDDLETDRVITRSQSFDPLNRIAGRRDKTSEGCELEKSCRCISTVGAGVL